MQNKAKGKGGKRRKRKTGRKYVYRRLTLLAIFLLMLGGGIYGLIRLGMAGVNAIQSRIEAANAPEPTPTPIPTATPIPVLDDSIVIEKNMESINAAGFTTSLMVNREEVSSFQRSTPILFGDAAEYAASVAGITTFGGNNWRNTFTYGQQAVNEGRLTRDWEINLGSLETPENGTWTGTGWTGQPLVIQWDETVLPTLGVYDVYKATEGFTEVIYPAMDGKIYFMELTTGSETRAPIDLGQVIKGTAMLDPRGYPVLYIGQGIPTPTETIQTMGAWIRAISLIDNTEIWSLGGRDPFSPRLWQAFDASPLLDAATDTLLMLGENGVLYTCKLNTSYDPVAGTLALNPDQPEKYTYDGNNYGESDSRRWWGMEDSLTIWRNYGFFADNGGYLQCVDLNTLELLYVTDLTDNHDATLVLEEAPEDGTVYLYSANTAEKQTVVEGVGTAHHRKINALTGEIVWEQAYTAAQGGGSVATPHVGEGDLKDLVIFACSDTQVNVNGNAQYGGLLIARRKDTGEAVWQVEQTAGYWSSPVVIYDQNDKGYILQCDRNGILHMYEGLTGAEVCNVDLGSRVESTPVVYNNILVVGTRGQYGRGETQKIISVSIR